MLNMLSLIFLGLRGDSEKSCGVKHVVTGEGGYGWGSKNSLEKIQ